MSSADLEQAQTASQEPNVIASSPKSEKIESEVDHEVASSSKDTKIIDEMEIQSAAPLIFVGLRKEDLLLLANRPYWVRLRWALFITFWLMWLGLLVGAALIIALSPGCEPLENVKAAGASSHHR